MMVELIWPNKNFKITKSDYCHQNNPKAGAFQSWLTEHLQKKTGGKTIEINHEYKSIGWYMWTKLASL